jgi:hypothetical protein
VYDALVVGFAEAQGHLAGTLAHGSPIGNMVGLNCPRPGAITDEVP